MHSEEGENNHEGDSLANQPEVHPRRGVRRRHVENPPAPTLSMGPSTILDPPAAHVPRLCVCNNVPFNPRERDNDIGVHTRRARPVDSRKRARHS
ncbi:uncharacterized protein F5147DRAFT_781760 [Suillus discolor]|uniref:Uncharacterized protein n=1 Tax=Suillus discolor TaxID=1912936 RepID=A0A9P7ESH6_9AGAM|nr:uncharacterized protein F5147DRAFT_781760 [Suillus discolor]KAG2086101.1 hypothetical protein F5147DRAFT_781760 [Suillus discolor]